MLAHRYKIWDWGDEIVEGQEDTIKYHAGVTVVAKRHKHTPYEPFNELVCMHLGRMAGLPIPVGFLIERVADEVYYCSGDVTYATNKFPPAKLSHLVENHPELACGIAVFDAWVFNPDRHAKNIFYDRDDGLIRLIDHGEALLNSLGISDLRQKQGELKLRQEFASLLERIS